MKKLLFVLLAITAGVFTSCTKDSDGKKDGGSYVFYQPIMNWNISMTELRTKMQTMDEWIYDMEASDDKDVAYTNRKNEAVQLSYSFKDDKMVGCDVCYIGCNDKYGKMKEDWTKALNLTWKEPGTVFGLTVEEANCEAWKCTVSLQQGESSGYKYMVASLQYTELFI